MSKKLGKFEEKNQIFFRKNAVILLSKILCSVSRKVYDVNGEEEGCILYIYCNENHFKNKKYYHVK